MSRRVQRLNEQFKREISNIVRTEVHDPRVGLPTITGAEVAPDLYHAKIHVRLMGSDEERREAMEGLEAAAPFIRRQLGQRLRVRRVPELEFEEDRTLEKAMRIEAILDQVRPEGGWEEGAEPEDGEEAS